MLKKERVWVTWMDQNMKKSKEFVKYVRGTQKQLVELSVTLDETGELIECGMNDAEHNGQGDGQ
jgi:hypothetical protein